jgi:hypothetical protein
MDRLKREWEQTEIPEEIKLQARNRAWDKLQRPVQWRLKPVWIAAASTIAAVVVLIWLWSDRDLPSQTANPIRPEAAIPVVAEPKTAPPQKVMPAAAGHSHMKKRVAPLAKEPERIVLNFVLPESGARMIWIIDSQFDLDGGVQ